MDFFLKRHSVYVDLVFVVLANWYTRYIAYEYLNPPGFSRIALVCITLYEKDVFIGCVVNTVGTVINYTRIIAYFVTNLK